MRNPTPKILLALMVAIMAALVTQPVHATVGNSLVITEISSDSLTASLTTASGTISLPVMRTAADHWTIPDLNGVFGASLWMEPGPAGHANLVQADPNFPNDLLSSVTASRSGEYRTARQT